ncbi:MAG TPA: hypothetical protein EYP25_05375 [Anaerolineae bacterium]|nr:hypothetical protein [Anaerolineae bacterium]HIQ11308.1 hypothetical protein [Caldilineales bacterium]
MSEFDLDVPRSVWLDRLGSFFLALILAVIVWVVAMQQQNPIITVLVQNVPVSVRNMPEDLVFDEDQPDLPDAVDLRVRGPQGLLNTLAPTDFKAYIDLSDAHPAAQEVKIQVDYSLVGVDVLDIYPDAVMVKLNRKVEKNVPVRANLIGDPPFGYMAATPIITPTTVIVRGPEPKVEKVVQAQISARLTDAREDVRVTDFVTLRDANGLVISGVQADPPTVTMVVPIVQRQGFTEKTVLPKVQGQPAANYRITGITVTPATVTLFGDPDTLNEMPPFVETAPVDISDATEDIEERVALVLPEAVAVVGQQAVVVHVQIEPIEGSLTLTLRPQVQGLNPDLKIDDVSPRTIDVILQGPLPKLQSLTADVNVKAVLNLSGLEEGAHTTIPIIIVPEGISVQTVLPESVQVTIVIKPTPTPMPMVTPTPSITATITPKAGATSTPAPTTSQ